MTSDDRTPGRGAGAEQPPRAPNDERREGEARAPDEVDEVPTADDADDKVDEASKESFPTSDPPAW